MYAVISAGANQQKVAKGEQVLVDLLDANEGDEVSLTARGRQILKRSPASIQVELMKALACLPGSTRRALATSLQALVRQMGAVAAPPMFFEEEPLRRGRDV